MPKYIDCENVIAAIKEYAKEKIESGKMFDLVDDTIALMNRIEALSEEVVRCCNCTMSRENDEQTLFCMLFKDTVDQDSFCGYGIQKEQEREQDQ